MTENRLPDAPANPSFERPGSARRAWFGVRNTAAIFAPLWIGSLFFGPESTGEGWADLTWVAIGTLYYVAALLVVLPAFAFTLGRWIDKRTWRGTRRAALIYGYYGLGWGVVALGVYGLGGNPGVGVAMWLLIPAIAAAGARMLLNVHSKVWTVISWLLCVLAVVPAVLLVIGQMTGSLS